MSGPRSHCDGKLTGHGVELQYVAVIKDTGLLPVLNIPGINLRLLFKACVFWSMSFRRPRHFAHLTLTTLIELGRNSPCVDDTS
jgi:hypothetical protein